MEAPMPNGNQGFFNTIVVAWSYDAAAKQLTVSGTVSGKPMTTAILTKQASSGAISGASGSNTATVQLAANFDTSQLGMDAVQTDPAKHGVANGSF
jgi:hypothetical protein